MPRAIQSFLSQTYQQSELLIVADGIAVNDLLPHEGERLRLIHLSEQLTIGHKRNFACSHAFGSAIAHWDDDDWSEPQRLADQVGRLHDCEVTGYCSMLFLTDAGNWWNYTAPPSYALGTSLCYWKSWWETHPFPTINVGEDNDFVQQAVVGNKLISVPARNHMYATIHSGNSSPRIYGSNWKQVAWATSPS